MATKTRISIRKVVVASIWLVLATGGILLLIAAMNKNKSETVSSINIRFKGNSHGFVNKKEVEKMVRRVIAAKPSETLMQDVDLRTIENNLRRDEWIESAEVFFDNKNVLQVQILEKEPVARVFPVQGRSFYLDSSLSVLPVQENFNSRLPVFTGFPAAAKGLSAKDSMLMKSIKKMALFLAGNDFWMAQIEQVDITPAGRFELVPKMGDQIIRFGSMDRYEEKFNNLFAFYKRVLMTMGWSRYSVIDVQYRGQVVALRKDAKEYKADSLQAVRVMKKLIEESEKKLRDTTNVQLPQQDNMHTNINRSREVEDDGFTDAPPPVKPAQPAGQINQSAPAGRGQTGGASSRAQKPPDKKPAPPAAGRDRQKPKAVMPARN